MQQVDEKQLEFVIIDGQLIAPEELPDSTNE